MKDITRYSNISVSGCLKLSLKCSDCCPSQVAVWLVDVSGELTLEVYGGVSLEMVVWLVPGGAQWWVDVRSVWWCES